MSTIYERALADKNVDEVSWLHARRTGVTATEVRDLAKSKNGWSNLAASKRSGERDFFGNKFTEWGLEREPFLVETMLKPEGFFGSDVLYHAEENKRHLATPDALYLSDGIVLVGEIKTSKHDVSPGSEAFVKAGYYDQIQFQMYVIGDDCMECLYVWEQHEDFTPLPAQKEWIKRDQKRIEELVAVADEFLAFLDSDAEQDDPADYEELVNKYITARASRDKYVEIMAELDELIRSRIGDRDSFSIETSSAKLSLSTPKPTERFDSAAFKSAQPDLFKQFVKVSQSKPSLRISALKEGNDVF
jgi:hypothetical protein